jgi:hypothetical protein
VCAPIRNSSCDASRIRVRWFPRARDHIRRTPASLGGRRPLRRRPEKTVVVGLRSADCVRSMLRQVVDPRALVAVAMAGAAGTWACLRIRFPRRTSSRGLTVELAPCLSRPVVRPCRAVVHDAVRRDVADMCLVAIVVCEVEWRAVVSGQSRRIPRLSNSPPPMLVIGEKHCQTTPGPTSLADCLTTALQGLCTCVMILDADGAAKTSRAHARRLTPPLAYRRPARKLGGLVLEERTTLRAGTGPCCAGQDATQSAP